MNEHLTQMEKAIGQHLRDQAADVPDESAMRLRVLATLEADSFSAKQAQRASRDRYRRPFVLLVGVAAAIAIAVAVVSIPRRLTETVDVITTDPVLPVPISNHLQLDPDGLRQALALRSIDEVGGEWAVLSETEKVVSLAFVSDIDDGTYPILRIVTPPAATTPEDVVASLTSTLFDTTVVSDAPGDIGGLETRVVRLETEAGTTRLGFRVASDTYVETAGENRAFVVHITTPQLQTVVVWVEAAPEEIDEFEPVADRLVDSLRTD